MQGYDSLYPRAYRELAAKIEGADPSPLSNGNMILLENAESPLLGGLGVKYVLTDSPIGSRQLMKVTQIGSIYIYRPTAFVSPYYVRPGGDIVFGLKMLVPLAATSDYGRMVFEVPPMTDEGAVKDAETPYPGWHAYLDGKPVAWTTESYLRLLREVKITAAPQPRHLDFAFQPTTVTLGLFLSLLALIAAVSLTFLIGRPFEDWTDRP